MQGVYCPGDVHWAHLEASALGNFCWLPRMEEKRNEEKRESPSHACDFYISSLNILRFR